MNNDFSALRAAIDGKTKLVNGFAKLAHATSREAAIKFLEDLLARERARSDGAS